MRKNEKYVVFFLDNFGLRRQVIWKLAHFKRKVLSWYLFLLFFIFIFQVPGVRGRVKLTLTTPPRTSMHVSCVSIQLNRIRNPALAVVSFISRDGDSTSCPYQRAPLLLRQRKL